MRTEKQVSKEMKEFFDSRVEKIRSLFDFAINNKFSNFYKEKYKDLDFDPTKISDYEQFLKIPVLHKDEILSLSLNEKTFVPQNMITHFSVSSGTATHNKPLVLPQFYPDRYSAFDKQILDYESMIYNEEHLVQLGVKNYLILAAPYMAPMSFLLYFPKKETTAIPGDIKNLSITSMIAIEAEVSGIVTTPTILIALSEELKKHLFNFEQIKWIYLFGEICSSNKLSIIKRTFPCASVEFVFGHSEVCNGASLPGKRCDNMSKQKPNAYHVASDYLLETVDDLGRLNSFEAPGQMILTSLHNPTAFPIIRYQMNDHIFLEKDDCECGRKINFYQLYEGGFEKFKIQGTTISTNSILRSLKEVEKYLKPYFVAHVFEDNTDTGIKVLLEIHLILKESYRTKLGLKELIVDTISNNLILSQNKSLKDLNKIGIYQPLKVIFIEKEDNDPGIINRIIPHL